MYEQLTELADALDHASGSELRSLCRQVETRVESSGLVRHDYMALLDARGIDEPWEAPVEELDLEGTLALLSFVHRAQRWRVSCAIQRSDEDHAWDVKTQRSE